MLAGPNLILLAVPCTPYVYILVHANDCTTLRLRLSFPLLHRAGALASRWMVLCATRSRVSLPRRRKITSAITTLGAHIAQKREMRANETRLTTDWDQEVWSIHAGCTLLQ